MVTIRPVQQDDLHGWVTVYKQYLAFYKTMLSEDQWMIVWNWFFDAHNQIYGHVALLDDRIIGLVHFREFLRPIQACKGMFMDDLFVDPAYRTQGIAKKLIQTVQLVAAAKNISTIRWITAENNETAIKLYETMATKTPWIMYDMSVD